ncbi:dihydropteroate synthase [Rhizobium sp. PAMB 3174]
MTNFASAVLRETEWRLAHGRTATLGAKGHIMAVVNVTPDSFSDGGLYQATDAAIAHALSCVEQGALIVDVGGESTRPGAAPVTASEEQERVLPVIAALAAHEGVLISVDTYRAETARLAIEAGAHIINDVHGAQREPDIAAVAAATGAGLVLMHTGRGRAVLPDVIDDQRAFFATSLEIADKAGVSRDQVVLDPGFGFAKETVELNMDLMARFDELHALGLPLLAGTSRKRFIGALTGREAADRDAGTAATTVMLRLMGAAIFRVHNVAMNRDALAVADAMLVTKQRMAWRPQQ